MTSVRVIKEILVCLEASPSSADAVEFAAAVAKRCGAQLVGLAVVDEPEIRAGTPVGIGAFSFKLERDEALVADAKTHAERWMAEFARRCDELAVPRRSLELIGRADTGILDEMRAHDLTVIGRDANFHWETKDKDSSTRSALLHRAKGPVILVPERPTGDRKKVLIAFDGSPASCRAIESFAESGLASGCQLHVVTCDEDGSTGGQVASRAIGILHEHGLPATPHNVVSVSAVPEAILELRQELDAGLLVIGAYGRSRFRELLRGSVTRALIERTSVPLFLHH